MPANSRWDLIRDLKGSNTPLLGSSRNWKHSIGRTVQEHPQVRTISVTGPADSTTAARCIKLRQH